MKLSEHAHEFFIDEEKGVVVCKIYDTSRLLLEDLARFDLAPAHEQAYEDSLLSDFYTGKAVCMNTDAFVVDTGKRIAYKKAVKKINIAKRKTLLRLVSACRESYMHLDEAKVRLIAKYDNAIGNCIDKIKHIGSKNDDSNKEEET